MAEPHGAHFDAFRQQSGSPHGGAEFDVGFGLQAHVDPHGAQFDRFSSPTAADARHGERWDEFGWKDMPVLHGNRFDEGFDNRTALADDAGHGTWFDQFRGGTQLRVLSDGAEYEAVILDLEADHAKVERRDGKRIEVSLGQILQWRDGPASDLGPERREADRPEAGMPMDAARGGAIAALNTDSIPRSDAEAPSAHSATAAGGGEQATIDPQIETPFMSLKTIGEVFDVGKLQMTGKPMADAVEQHRTNIAHIANGDHGKVKCPGCGTRESYDVGHTPAKGAKMGSSKMFGSCRGCGFSHTFPAPKIKRQPKTSRLAGKTADDDLDVAKDSSATHVCSNGSCGAKFQRDAHKSASRAGPYFRAAGASSGQSKTCHGCGVSLVSKPPKPIVGKTEASRVDVAKDVDSTETAVQGNTDAGAGEGKAWCASCQHFCRKVQGGKCPTCGGKVSVRKAARSALDTIKMLAERAGVTR